MQIIRLSISIFMLLSPISMAFAQQQVIAPIKQLFDGMRAGDSTMIAEVFTSDASLQTYMVVDGKTKVQTTPAKAFVAIAGQPHTPVWNEVIWSYDVRVDEPLATVWTEYTFYLGDQLSHCGVNAFKMIKSEDRWKIASITDTRSKTNCRALNSPDESASVQNEIDKTVWTPFKEAFDNMDAEAMVAIHSDDVIRATSRNIEVGEDYLSRIRSNYKQGKEDGRKRTIEFTFDFRNSSENLAVETGIYKITSGDIDNPKYYYGYFHVILKKINDQWKITYDWDNGTIADMQVNESWIK